jgi:hypothetical protein
MIKFWLIKHEILDIIDPSDPLDTSYTRDLLAADSDLPFKKLINFSIFDDLTDFEVMKSVLSYRILELRLEQHFDRQLTEFQSSLRASQKSC